MAEKKKKRSKKNPLLSKVVPQKLLMKFDPPLIAVVYKRNVKDKKKFIYQIFLQNLIENESAKEVTEVVYKEHHHYLKDVKKDQVLKLVTKILKTYNPDPDDLDLELDEGFDIDMGPDLSSLTKEEKDMYIK